MSDSESYAGDWFCGDCHKPRHVDGKKHKDMDPLATRVLFGEKFSLCEISNVMERENMEKAHWEGWLKHVFEEASDYDMPELIDPDEADVEMADRIGSDGDGGTIPVLLESGDCPLTRVRNMGTQLCRVVSTRPRKSA